MKDNPGVFFPADTRRLKNRRLKRKRIVLNKSTLQLFSQFHISTFSYAALPEIYLTKLLLAIGNNVSSTG
jgi:hypothetical protein